MKQLIGCFISILCLSSLGAQNVDSSLIVYYKFESNVIDSGFYHNDGIAFGSSSYVQGISGLALAFDGENDFVTVPGTAALHNIKKEFTIAAWIKPLGVPDFYLPILTKGNTPDMNTPFAVVYRSAETTPYIRIEGENLAYETVNIEQALNAVPLYVWTYFTWTFKNGLVTIYQNGIKIASHQFDFTNLATNNLPMEIGRDVPGFNTERLFGLLDELAIFNRELDKNQVADLYHSFSASSTVDTEAGDGIFITLSPNPTASKVTLSYGFEKTGLTEASIFNSNGQLIKTLCKEQQDLKTNTLIFDTSDFVPGLYQIIVNRNGKTLNKSLIVVGH